MGNAKTYTVLGVLYPRQVDLEAAVKSALNRHPKNVRFVDPFLAAVVNEHHPEVKIAGQRATGQFEYLDFQEQLRRGLDSAQRFRGGNLLMGFFKPLDEWRDVTVYPWRGQGNHRQDIKLALREILAPLLPKPAPCDRCTYLGCRASGSAVEYHHVSPTFDAIAEACLGLMAPEEISTRFGYSKFVRGRDDLFRCLPSDHPAVTFLLQSHTSNQWEWLCKAHHRNVGTGAKLKQRSLF